MSTTGYGQYRHFEEASALVAGSADEVFNYLDDHRSIAAHMDAGGSPMMGGGQMSLELDAAGGRELGSHIRMTGTAFGLKLALDQVVVERTPPHSKTWQTVSQRLLVIGEYAMGYQIEPRSEGAHLTVWIRYNSAPNRLLGLLGGKMYARWCVDQMRDAAVRQFGSVSTAAGSGRKGS